MRARKTNVWAIGWTMLFISGCVPTAAERREAARPSLRLLQDSKFDEARRAAEDVIREDGHNPEARAVAALTRYKATMHQLSADMRTLPMQIMAGGTNHRYFRFSLQNSATELAAVEEDLRVASDEPQVDVELCIACWKVDWNMNGRLDDRDERVFEIEKDADGNDLPDGDPRRRPTFHFDRGDLFWARAMLSFQRALIELVLAYKWEALETIRQAIWKGPIPEKITITLGDKSRVERARTLLREGLAHADRTRREYLAETDDDREWVPNPHQKSHPMPLPVDDTLYQTWAAVVGDLTALLDGKEGVSVAEVAQLGDRQWDKPPRGFLDINQLFASPGDIDIPVALIESGLHNGDETNNAQTVLESLFGKAYVKEMKPTPLLGRFARMKGEVKRGEESFDRKLRYLFWLN